MPLVQTPEVNGSGVHSENYGTKRQVNTNTYRVGALKLGPLPKGDFTYSESLEKIEWEKILPESSTIKSIFQKKLFNFYFKRKITNNILQLLLAGACFLFAFVILLIRDVHFVSIPSLFNSTHITEHLTQFANAPGYFLGPLIILVLSCGFNIWILIDIFLESKKSLVTTLNEYIQIRQSIINSTKYTMVFFAICEIIYKLKTPHTAQDLIDNKKRIKGLFDKVNKCVNPQLKLSNIHKNTGYYSLDAMPSDILVMKLFYFLRCEEFEFITDRLKDKIKDNITSLYSKGNKDLNTLSLTTVLKFCDNVDCLPSTMDIIIYYIGEISSDKKPVRSSMLVQQINAFEEGLDELIKSSIIKYWNDAETTNAVHPHNVAGKKLARIVNLKIIEKCFHIISSAEYIAHQYRITQQMIPTAVLPPPPPSAPALFVPLSHQLQSQVPVYYPLSVATAAPPAVLCDAAGGGVATSGPAQAASSAMYITPAVSAAGLPPLESVPVSVPPPTAAQACSSAMYSTPAVSVAALPASGALVAPTTAALTTHAEVEHHQGIQHTQHPIIFTTSYPFVIPGYVVELNIRKVAGSQPQHIGTSSFS